MSSVMTASQPQHVINDCLDGLALLEDCAGDEEAVVCLPVAAAEFRLFG